MAPNHTLQCCYSNQLGQIPLGNIFSQSSKIVCIMFDNNNNHYNKIKLIFGQKRALPLIVLWLNNHAVAFLSIVVSLLVDTRYLRHFVAIHCPPRLICIPTVGFCHYDLLRSYSSSILAKTILYQCSVQTYMYSTFNMISNNQMTVFGVFVLF